MISNSVRVKVRQFILLEECPPEWNKMDLYVFRDEETVFYVGQSYSAFNRIWDHIRNGYKARSDIGRFILCNWPKSMNIEIELLCSQSPEFSVVHNDLLLAEEILIRRYTPCLNSTLNDNPSPLPDRYAPLGSPLRCSRSIRKLQVQAEQSIRNEERKKWLEP